MRKVSDILREARIKRGVTLDEVERETKIKKEFLESIEQGDFQDLPSESYAFGFVKNYARYLDLPLSSTLPIFRREYKLKHKVHIVPEFRKSQHKFNRRFLSARMGLLLAGAIIIIGYIFFQYSSLIFPPPLSISSPKNGNGVEGNIVKIVGKTDPYATVTIDGQEVYVNLKGEFQKSIYLFEGDDKVKIVAKNRFGKIAQKIVTVKVD